MYWSHRSYELYLKKQYEMQEVRASTDKVQIEEDKEIGIKFLAKEHIKNRFQLLSDLDLKVETSNEARR